MTLHPGGNLVSYTGSGGDVAELTADIEGLETAFVYGAGNQRWLAFIPGAPPRVNQFSTLSRLDGVYLVVAATATWTFTE